MAAIRRRLAPWFNSVVIASIVVLFVAVLALGGVLVRERDNRITENRVITCAIGDFSGDLVDYFEGARERTASRIGTPDELPTDARALREVSDLLNTATELNVAVAVYCP